LAPHGQLLPHYALVCPMPVVILVADGARPDTLRDALDRGALPALARLRDEGGLFDITSVFPSVTGPAYTPFVMGRHPAGVGLPALRWYDRTRSVLRWPYARSYVGLEYRRFATDVAADAPTLWESTRRTLGALPVIARGLPPAHEIGRGPGFSLRAALTHVRGNVRGWLDIDRATGAAFVQRWAAERPEFALAAFTGVDKTSHAYGHTSDAVQEALTIVDAAAAGIRRAAEQAGIWDATHVWIVSDHGHEPLHTHDDLAGAVRSMGYRTAAHPWEWPREPEVAVMVSGNAMAHVYVGLDQRTRPGWSALRSQWSTLADALVARASVDVALLPELDGSCLVQSAAGAARVSCTSGRWSYTPLTGDPFGVGTLLGLDDAAAYAAMAASDYPDALVQCTSIAASARGGDIILSSAEGWDLRSRWEPIPHHSSHGSLRRSHMAVPLLVNRVPERTPRRTTDIGATAFALVGTTKPRVLDGHAWLGVEQP
jgi:hypothetical protein